MRLKSQVSRATNLEPQIIIEAIISRLKGDEYRVTNVTDNSVTFDDDTSGIWPTHTMDFRRLRKGKFEISMSDKENIVELKYSEWILVQLLLVIFVGVLGIRDGNAGSWPFFLLFCGIISVGKFLRIVAVKDESTIMLREILKTE